VETPPDKVALAPGVIVGSGYRVVRTLAEGGMGTVYEVQQVATGARRALKVMQGQFARDPALRARFVREARLTAEIASDHIAQVIDAGDDEPTGSLYIVMELLEGATLSSELRRRGAFAWDDVVEIVRQMAHGMGAAHARGIVHRDLKPANVFLSRSRTSGLPIMVKVLDFGIAKAVAGGKEATLAILGTPSWMAPEQSTADADVGPQADVWALGLLTFMLVAGQHYFPSAAAKNPATAAVLREVVVEPIVPASTRATQIGVADRFPAGFDEWFGHCVHRNPMRRFEDATAAYEALAKLPSPTLASPGPSRIIDDPPPSSAVLERPNTPITAIETPHPSRVSLARAMSGPPSRDTGSTVAQPRPWRRGLLAIAGIGALVGGVLYVRHEPPPSQQAASSPAQPAPQPASTALVRMHGSNTIGAELAPALAEAFLQRRTGAKTVVRRRTAADEMVVEARDGDRVLDSIEISAHGSATAFEDLASGRCDIGMSSRRIKADEVTRLGTLGNMASAASEHVVALDGIAVIVNPTNPVTTLTKAQIADLFAGAARSWTDVGGTAQPVDLMARDDKSGTFDTFKHMVLGSRSLADGARRFEASEALSDAVAEDAKAVGFIGLPYVRSAKAVLVQDGKSQALLPSPMTVATEDYPLARRLYLYVALGAPPAARELLDFAMSDEGQRAVRAAGFVDLQPRCDQNAARCTACTREYRDAVKGACRLSLDLRFDAGSTQLDTRALVDLQRIVALMGRPDGSGKTLVLIGFADAKATRADNVTESLQVATVVATQLRGRGLYVDAVKGLGSDMPVASDETNDGRERNRRVEVWLH
jgi:phosphate transport system substrate-binding protein